MCLSQARDNRISLYSEDEKRVVRLRSIENDFTDEFEIVGEKGRGGSCIVYLAVKYQNGKRELPVLLKEFYPSRFSNFLFRDVSTSALTFVNSTGDDNYRDSFITARDCFINICNKQKDFYLLHVTEADELVEIQGFYELGESCYAVMRAAGGQSWDQISRESLFELIETSISVLHELSVYHDDNILHGDIKPENVYIFNKTRQHVRLLDFGSMQILSENSLNGTETLSYSEAFASPEVLNAIGKEGIDRADYYSCITKKSDLYSLAAVLYYKITGKFPPQKMNDKLKRDQRNEELSLLWEREKNGWLKNISASVMSDLARFFDSMLSWNPKSRFDIDEMEQRLKLIMKHIPPPTSSNFSMLLAPATFCIFSRS